MKSKLTRGLKCYVYVCGGRDVDVSLGVTNMYIDTPTHMHIQLVRIHTHITHKHAQICMRTHYLCIAHTTRTQTNTAYAHGDVNSEHLWYCY